ncbi:hypothetical protein [Nocardia sp. MH4]|uniref:hypothetical protein n=1 Tax=Nocardia sp. MH4 TaxID=1768677 RepID=UPI001C4FDAF4|nr:hypothetical protein [Nocardia sp. MH4]
MPNTVPTGAGLLALLAILGAFEASQNAPDHDETADKREDGTAAEQPDEAGNVYLRHASDAEARAAFFAANRREIEDEAVAVVALMPSADGELRARVLHTSAACAYGQALSLHDVADRIAASHDPAACAARRRAKAHTRN